MTTKKTHLLIGGTVLAIILVMIATPSFSREQQPQEVATEAAAETTTDITEFRTTLATKSKTANSALLVGTVISNETANIYPRRDGVVADVLVDIGDPVRKDQVVAVLLPRGVEGQSSAAINERGAYVAQSSSDYEMAQQVAAARIAEAEQMLADKRITLQNTMRNTEATIAEKNTGLDTTISSQAEKYAAAMQQVEVAKATLELARTKLVSQQSDREQKILRAETDITQALDQLEKAITHIRQTAEQIFADVGIETRERTANGGYRALQQTELPYEFGFNDQAAKTEMTNRYNHFRNAEANFLTLSAEAKKDAIAPLNQLANELLDSLQTVLSASRDSQNVSQALLASMLTKAQAAHELLLRQEEKYQDAKSAFAVTLATENEQTVTLEAEVQTQTQMLAAAEQAVMVIESDRAKATQTSESAVKTAESLQTSEIEALKSQVAIAEKNLELVRAQQTQAIERARTSLGIAGASYTKEQAASGHQEIRSPFDGIVSKRFLQVGESTMPSMPAFELVDVRTTLSEKAKREIEFGLPEDFAESIAVGDVLEYLMLENADEVFTAEVTRISPQLDSATHTFTVRAKVADEQNLPHNTSVRVRIDTGEAPVYRVPATAIERENGANFVWVLSEAAEPQRLSVNVLAEEGEFAEVTGALSETTQIILDPPDIFLSPPQQ